MKKIVWAVSGKQWKTDNESGIRGYKFSYDGLDRLTTAAYGERADMSLNAGRYDERVTGYTANGSMTGLWRNGKKDDGTYGLADDLNITLNGNRLYSITDKAAPVSYDGAFGFRDNTVSVTGAEYQYDGNGNLVSDTNKGIAKIEYDNMNHPRRVHEDIASLPDPYPMKDISIDSNPDPAHNFEDLSTGETELTGKTLFPDEIGPQNSPNGNVQVYINSDLSLKGRSEAYSHEANGHVLMYFRTRYNHEAASHHSNHQVDTNLVLKDLIIKSKMETIKNY